MDVGLLETRQPTFTSQGTKLTDLYTANSDCGSQGNGAEAT
jgi:hypothetical protein